MKFEQYIPLAVRTEKPLNSIERLIHGCMGLITESGEVVTELKRMHIYEKPLDSERIAHIGEELGDMLWYVAIMVDAMHPKPEFFKTLGREIPSGEGDVDKWAAPSLLFSVVIGSISGTLVNLKISGQESSDLQLLRALDRLVQDLQSMYEAVNFVANLCGLNIEQIMDANIAKLQVRFPDKYTNEAAEARADKAGADARVS